MYTSYFPLLSQHEEIIYLDSASTAQKPAHVIDALSHFFQNDSANIHRGAYDLSMAASLLYEKAKKAITTKLSAESESEIVFTYNATYAFNLIARGLVKSGILTRGDRVLLSKLDHHANIVPWHIIASEYGIILDWVGVHEDGTLDYVDLEAKIKYAKVLSITGASNVTGEILDLARVRDICSRIPEKPLFILDGSQRFPHLATNVREYGVDMFVATGHKVMSDTGIGFFYAKKDLLKRIDPAFCGGGAINSVSLEGYEPAGLPYRHEPGTPHIAGAVSLLAAMEFIDLIGGYSAIESYEQTLVEYALEKIQQLPRGIRLIGSDSALNRLGVFSFVFDDHHPNDIAELLADVGICVRSGHHCTEPLHDALGIRASLRMSLYLYNTKKDIDAFFTHLEKFTSHA